MKRDLLKVNIIAIDSIDPRGAAAAINYCQRFFNFGKAILVTHQKIEVNNIELHISDKKIDYTGYSDEILHLSKHTSNDYIMIVQADGHILNPDLWTDRFLEYDYIGAPWPIEDSWIDVQREDQREVLRANLPKNRVGNGGFSLRSRKFLEFSRQFENCEGYAEDSYLCTRKYDAAVGYGIRFAPFELAIRFSYENPCYEYDGFHWHDQIDFDPSNHLGWHGSQFANKDQMLARKYQ